MNELSNAAFAALLETSPSPHTTQSQPALLASLHVQGQLWPPPASDPLSPFPELIRFMSAVWTLVSLFLQELGASTPLHGCLLLTFQNSVKMSAPPRGLPWALPFPTM